MIAVVDYGMGNLRSAQKGLEKGGFEASVTDDPSTLEAASGIVLPGVGAFRDCYEGLREAGFLEPLLDQIAADKPLLGICVGMQMLFEFGEEGEGSPGLGILPGRVVRFPARAKTGLKVPHMGWNVLERNPARPCPLLDHCSERPYVYFVHSYRPETPDDVVYAWSTYGVRFPAMVGRGNVFGAQFHPEKSQAEGIGILRAFGEYVQRLGQSATLTP